MKHVKHDSGSDSQDVKELCYGGFAQCLECYAINQTEDAPGIGQRRCSNCRSYRIKIHPPCLSRPSGP